jgi:sarcosine oxidase
MHFAPGAWGIFEPESGALMARRAVEAVVADAVRHGVTFLREAVTAARHGAVRWRRSSGVFAGAFVFACGPWLPKDFSGSAG